MSTILPTHTCFDDALDYLTERAKRDGWELVASALVVVHAICLAPDGPHRGEQFAHAWVEEGPTLWQGGILEGQRVFWGASAEEVRAELRVQMEKRYTPAEAAILNRTHNTFGPWDPRIKMLCGGALRVYVP